MQTVKLRNGAEEFAPPEAEREVIMKTIRRLRVIEQLRHLYPGIWTYVGMGLWQGPDFDVRACSNLVASSWGGDDGDTYRTYHRTDTGERVLDSVFR